MKLNAANSFLWGPRADRKLLLTVFIPPESIIAAPSLNNGAYEQRCSNCSMNRFHVKPLKARRPRSSLWSNTHPIDEVNLRERGGGCFDSLLSDWFTERAEDPRVGWLRTTTLHGGGFSANTRCVYSGRCLHSEYVGLTLGKQCFLYLLKRRKWSSDRRELGSNRHSFLLCPISEITHVSPGASRWATPSNRRPSQENCQRSSTVNGN